MPDFSPSELGAEPGVRLQRVLAGAGVGSRRACEELIAAGRVSVNGERVVVQGSRVDPTTAVILVDGQRVVAASAESVYLLLNKPKGVLSAMSDSRGRACLGDYVMDRTDRVFHAGRLDADSEGLILMTNDGDLVHRLTHPSFEVPKTYLVEVIGPIGKAVSKTLKAGVQLEDGVARVDAVKFLGAVANRVMIELTLHEGRKHVVRRLMEEVGHPVQRLVRTAIGPIQLGSLRVGRTRHLTRSELGALYQLVGL